MMQFEYDPEQLIEEVKKREGIWNADHVDYRLKKTKAKQWQEVVKELMDANNIQLSKSEMRELGVQLQKKWKSLRDCFQKYLVNPNKFKRPYIYAKQLEFLMRGRQIPNKRKEDSSDSDDYKPKSLWVSKKKIKLQKFEEESDEYNEAEPDTDTTEYQPQIAVEAKNNMDVGHSSSFAFANVAETILKSDSECTDKMFLLSLLPHLKSIPEEFRLDVKLELMQVLRVANERTTKQRYPPSSID